MKIRNRIALISFAALSLYLSAVLPAYAAATPLTSYFTNNAATTVTTANIATTTAPSSAVGNTSKIAKSTGWVELWSQGNTANNVTSTEMAADGHGFLHDSTFLEGKTIVGGSWTPTLNLKVSAGSIVADIYVRGYVRSSGGTYTQIFRDKFAAQTIGTTLTQYSVPVIEIGMVNLNTGDKLYYDVVLDITTNSTNSTTATATLEMNGGSGESVVTPGYQTQHDPSFQVDTGGTLTTGLQAYYKEEDNTEFFVGGGTEDFTTSTMAFVTGKVNNAASGTTGTSIQQIASNYGIGNGTTTIALWFNASALPAANTTKGIAALGDATNHVSNNMMLTNIGGTLNVRCNRRKIAVSDNDAEAAETVNVGTWYFMAYTYDGSTLKCFFNSSSSIASFSVSGNGSSGGYTSFTTDEVFLDSEKLFGPIKVDEAGVWNKVLSATELNDLINGGSGQTMVNAAAGATRKRPPLINIVSFDSTIAFA